MAVVDILVSVEFNQSSAENFAPCPVVTADERLGAAIFICFDDTGGGVIDVGLREFERWDIQE